MDSGNDSLQPRPRPSWAQILLVGRNPKVTAVRLIATALLVLGYFRWMALPIRVTGVSMEPTFLDGQRTSINRVSLWMHPPERGDVLAIRTSGLHNLLLKRVIALPGERVHISRGTVYINGNPLEEPYVVKRAPWNWPRDREDEVIGSDEFLVIGDNRGMPQDRHEFGVARRERLVGRATHK
jgi:signal peptidase I